MTLPDVDGAPESTPSHGFAPGLPWQPGRASLKANA